METSSKPIKKTIISGLICATVFMPACLGLNYVLNREIALNLSLFLCFTIFTIFLPPLARRHLGPFAALLLTTGLSAFLTRTTPAYAFLLLTAFGLTRGLHTFQAGWFRALTSELLLCFGGGMAVAVFHPDGLISWALAIWMFALIQGFYFIIFPNPTNMVKKQVTPDPFDLALRRAQDIIGS